MSHDLTTLTDFHLRYALKQSLYARFANNPQVLIVDELGLQNGLARIDVAVIGSYFHGFELKSDRDSLERLPRQVKIYNSVLERVTLVVGYRHLYEALQLIPKWWGVKLAEVTFNHRVHISTARLPRNNPGPNKIAIAKLLWKDEAIEALGLIGEETNMRYKTKDEICKKLADKMNLSCLRVVVKQKLRSRVNWRVE